MRRKTRETAGYLRKMQDVFLIRVYQLTSLWKVWLGSLLGKLVSSLLRNPYRSEVLLMLGDVRIISHTDPTSAVSPYSPQLSPGVYANIPTVTRPPSNTLCIPHTELSHYENLMMSFLKLKPSRASLFYFLTISSKSSL